VKIASVLAFLNGGNRTDLDSLIDDLLVLVYDKQNKRFLQEGTAPDALLKSAKAWADDRSYAEVEENLYRFDVCTGSINDDIFIFNTTEDETDLVFIGYIIKSCKKTRLKLLTLQESYLFDSSLRAWGF